MPSGSGLSEGSAWRSEAAGRFPELRESLAEAESPYAFWTDLRFEFEDAYDSGNRERVAAIYDYARWCFDQPRGQTAEDDLPTCVSMCFVEHIPEHPKALVDMPNWWSIEDIRRMESLFRYHSGDDGYAKILAQFGVQRR